MSMYVCMRVLVYVYVCMCCAFVYVCVHAYVCRSEVNVRCLSQLSPILFLHQGFLQIPELIDLISLAIQLA